MRFKYKLSQCLFVSIMINILRKRKDAKFESIDSLLTAAAYEPKRDKYYYIYRKKGANPITVPCNCPIFKEHYIKELIDALNLEEFHDKKHK